MGTNVYEARAREQKALVLVHALEAEGVTPGRAAMMNAPQWRALARGQGVNPPSVETVEVVVQMLARNRSWRERTRTDDPFADMS